MPRQNSQEEIARMTGPRQGALLVRNILLALLAVGLVLAFFAYKRVPVLRAAWKKAGPGGMVMNEPLQAAPGAVAARPATETPFPGSPAPRSTLSPDDQAQRIWADFERTSWNETLQTWSGQHQEISCKSFRGGMWGLDADRQWSHRCATGEQPESARWSFYVFGLQEPLTPRLEQFEESSPTFPEEELKTLQTSLVDRLAMRFGPGEDRSHKPLTPHAFWWPQLHWATGDIEIQLFASEFDPQRKQGRLRLLARHRMLLEALQEDERLRLVDAGNFWYQAGSPIDKELAENLRSEFPDAAAMLMKERPDADPEEVRKAIQQFQSQLKASQSGQQTGARAMILAVPQNNWRADEFHGALLKLLSGGKNAMAERKPVLLLAADRLAWRLPRVIKNDKSRQADWGEWRKQLSEWGVTYEHSANSIDDSDGYNGSLLRRVWSDYGDTPWGERAFLALQRGGWDTSEECAAGSDAFRTVIQRGLDFEQKHPHSAALPEVELTVAQAYETWWSLSQAPSEEEDSDVVPANYLEGSDEARQKAIAAYEQLLQSAPQSDEAAYARRVLPRLKLGVDTGQRRYYCTVGD